MYWNLSLPARFGIGYMTSMQDTNRLLLTLCYEVKENLGSNGKINGL